MVAMSMLLPYTYSLQCVTQCGGPWIGHDRHDAGLTSGVLEHNGLLRSMSEGGPSALMECSG